MARFEFRQALRPTDIASRITGVDPVDVQVTTESDGTVVVDTNVALNAGQETALRAIFTDRGMVEVLRAGTSMGIKPWYKKIW